MYINIWERRGDKLEGQEAISCYRKAQNRLIPGRKQYLTIFARLQMKILKNMN